jgi:N4-gp56 family major capsid protein
MPGESVVFQIHPDLAPATTPLDEVTDPNSVALSNTTTVTVTLEEYGNWINVTSRLKNFALDNNLDSNVVSRIANNLADSVDKIVANVLDSGDNNIIEAEATGVISVVAQDDLGDATVDSTLTAKAVRYAVAKLRAASVPTFDGMNYIAYIHPEVASDFRANTDASAWRESTKYTDASNILAGEIGVFEGVRFVETARAPKTGAGIYSTFIMGREALAEAVAEEFNVVVDGDIVDPLNRKTAIGWKGTAGWSIFRPESLYVVKSISEIA